MIAQKVPGATVAAGRRGILASERKLLLAAGDTVLVAASLIIAFNLRSGLIQHAELTIPWLGVHLVTAIWLATALVVDAYDLHAAVSVRAIFRVVATTTAIEDDRSARRLLHRAVRGHTTDHPHLGAGGRIHRAVLAAALSAGFRASDLRRTHRSRRRPGHDRPGLARCRGASRGPLSRRWRHPPGATPTRSTA